MRFPDYAGDWKLTTISNIAEVVGGGTPKTEVEEYWNGNIKWFTPSEIGKSKFILDSERHITEEGLKNSSAKLLPKNTIFIDISKDEEDINKRLLDKYFPNRNQISIFNEDNLNEFEAIEKAYAFSLCLTSYFMSSLHDLTHA